MTRIDAVLAAAAERLSPRQHYARDVLLGRQAWSGADLKGNAKKWSSYSRQRDAAERALVSAGGCTVYVSPAGRRVSAVEIGQDDYGNALYSTAQGTGIVSHNYRVRIL